MSNTKIEEAILQAINIVTEKKIEAAQYDKTIQAIIISCEDETIGKYKVKYQDSLFFAYSGNTNVSYSKGTSVYVLVPNGDMTKDKTILGATKKLGTDYINNFNENDLYEQVGTNVIQIKSGKENYGELCSYTTDVKVLYDIDQSNSNNQTIILNENILLEYFRQSSFFSISMDIRNNLNVRQRYQGDYGVIVALDFIDPLDINNSNAYITKYYTLNVDKMTGNPYSYQTSSNQQAYFEMDGANFLRIRSISLFVKNFPLQQDGKPADIFISNLSLGGANKFAAQDLNGCLLTLLTPKGFIFNENVVRDDEKKLITRPIKAELRVKGKTVDTSVQPVEFYWFIQNLSITSGSPYYTRYGGERWKCINPYNVISEEDNINHTPAVYEFLSGSDSLTVTLYDAIAKITKYKCVAVYNQNIYSKEINIINNNSNYDIIIESQAGEDFFNNQGGTDLICKCLRKENNSEQYQEVAANQLKFIWGVTDNTGNFDFLNQNSSLYTINNNIVSNILIKNIVNFVIFKCSVFDKATNTFLGTASINLNNFSREQPPIYTLVLNNGSQVFKYDTHGIAPISEKNDNPLQIANLTFTLYNELGEEIQHQHINPTDISWIVPNKNTLLQINYNDSGEIIPDENEVPEYKVYHTDELSYTIQNYYNINYTNNNIELRVTYQNYTVRAYTNFTFLKQGDSGTNGTDFVCRIIPNVVQSSRIPTYPTIYSIGNQIAFNWQIPRKTNGDPVNNWFIAELWQNGEKIFSGSSSSENVFVVNWEVLKNKYNINLEDTTNLQIQQAQSQDQSWNFSLINSSSLTWQTWRPANIIKVTLSYEGNTYYATLPVTIAWVKNTENNVNYEINLKESSGFNRVLYTAAGLFPAYNNNNIFELEINRIENNEKIQITDNCTYNWYYNGRIKFNLINSNEWGTEQETVDQNGVSSGKWLQKSNLLSNLNPNQKAIKPVESYDGQCVNVGLICQIFKENNDETPTKIGQIYIPIHMMRNRFENSAINGWDGNSVNLGGDNGGMIIAPQVGAGIKDNQNKFTGVFIGTAKDPDATAPGSSNANAQDVGLFGYAGGSRSIFLDAKTGKAVFGEKEKGQIIIDPGDATSPAIIRSGNYSTNEGTGMEINLSGTNSGNGPYIKFGSGNFEVDKNGNIKAVGEGQIAGWKINDYQISNDLVAYNNYSIEDTSQTNPTTVYGLTGMNGVRTPTASGARLEWILVPPVSQNNDPAEALSYRAVQKSIAFWAEQNPSNDSSNAFKVTHDGWLIARKACIGSGTRPVFIGGSGNNSYIFSGLKSSINANKNGFYLGTNGLGIGPLSNDEQHSKFQVSSNGILYATGGYFSGEIQSTSGKIGGWTIGSHSIYNENVIQDFTTYTIKSRVSFSDGTNNTNDILVVKNYQATKPSGYEIDDTASWPFFLRADGRIHASKGDIGGWNINNNGFYSNPSKESINGDEYETPDNIPINNRLSYSVGIQSTSRKCFYVSTTRNSTTEKEIITMQVQKDSQSTNSYYYNGCLTLANNYNDYKTIIDSKGIALEDDDYTHSIDMVGTKFYIHVGSNSTAGAFIVRAGINTNWLVVQKPSNADATYPLRTTSDYKNYDIFDGFNSTYGVQDYSNLHDISKELRYLRLIVDTLNNG